jgi:hypothetical protein
MIDAAGGEQLNSVAALDLGISARFSRLENGGRTAYAPIPGRFGRDAGTRSWKSPPRAQEFQVKPSFPRCLLIYDFPRGK